MGNRHQPLRNREFIRGGNMVPNRGNAEIKISAAEKVKADISSRKLKQIPTKKAPKNNANKYYYKQNDIIPHK
jgi:hypothetical protein